MATVENKFSSVVRARLLENKLAGRKPDSIRGLARTLSNGDSYKTETFKRAIFKWMSIDEPNPSPASRALVADALGIEREELTEDDDEESDPVAALMHALKRFVREELRDERGSLWAAA